MHPISPEVKKELITKIEEAAGWDWYDEIIMITLAKKIIESFPTSEPENRWIPVTERLPEKNCQVIVSVWYLLIADFVDWYFYQTESYKYLIPTHWQPLPKPPVT